MASKRLYTGFSVFQFFWALFLRLCCVFGLFYSLSHYDENPVVIIIASVLCLIFLFFIGDDQIIVYPDKVKQTTSSLASLYFKTKGNTYNIQQIKTAHLQPVSKADPSEIGFALFLALILPINRTNRDRTQPIFFKLKTGETVKFDTNLEYGKMKRIVQLVNSLTK